MQFYISHHQQQLGPYTEAEVRAKLSDGSISQQDLIWWQGQAEWLPISQSFLAPPANPAFLPRALPPVPPAPVASQAPGSAPARLPKGVHTSTLAIGSLILGVLSVGCCGYSGVGAIITGHLGLAEIKRYPEMKGRGMAIAGMVLGYLALGLYVLRLFRPSLFVMHRLWFPHFFPR